MRKFYMPALAIVFLFSLGFHPSVLAQTDYTYDAAGRLIRIEHPSGWATVYQYDSAGNRTQKVVTFGNLPPVAVDDSIELGACQLSHTFDPKVNDSDPEQGALTIVSKTDGSKGTVSIISNELRYDRNQPLVGGADSFTYTIEDPQQASDTATVNVTIPEIPSQNVAPVAADDFPGQAVPPLGTLYVSVLSNDTDANCDTLTVTGAISQTGGITAQVVGTQVKITHTGPVGQTLIIGLVSYTISDGRGGTDNGMITFAYWGENFGGGF